MGPRGYWIGTTVTSSWKDPQGLGADQPVLHPQACLEAEVTSVNAGGGGLLGSLPTVASLTTSCVFGIRLTGGRSFWHKAVTCPLNTECMAPSELCHSCPCAILSSQDKVSECCPQAWERSNRCECAEDIMGSVVGGIRGISKTLSRFRSFCSWGGVFHQVHAWLTAWLPEAGGWLL